MFIAENTIDEKVKISISTSHEKPIRSLAKALSWRITGSLDTVMISILFPRTCLEPDSNRDPLAPV